MKCNVSTISEKHLEFITQVAARTALEHLEKQKTEQEKKKYDRRLRNVKLLLRNYRSFAKHCDSIKLEIHRLDTKLEIDDLDTDEFVIKSIKRSKERTLAMVKYINKMLEVYEFMCEQSGEEEDKRRYRIIYELYIAEIKQTAKQVSAGHSVHLRTIYKDVDKASEALAVLMFGIDGVKFNR